MGVATNPRRELTLRTVPEFDGIWEIWPRGRRLDALRKACAAFKARFRAEGEILGVRSFDIAAAPYPVRYAFGGAAFAPNPLLSIINRMLVVQYQDFDGQRRTLVWEPTVPAGSAQAPFYAQLERMAGPIPQGLFVKYYHEPEEVLPLCGLTNADVDVASFDHLHVQDMRMILGTTAPIAGEPAPREPLFPNARFVVHARELATFESPHPMQWAWYVPDGMRDARTDRLEVIETDVQLGPGVAIITTPGHTDGNHSLLLNTPDGVWVSSENGVALDNWQPDRSRIPGIRRHARFFNREIVPNANTLEDSIDQYDSMVKEKLLADPSRRDPRWLQILPSSELAPWRRQWPVLPSFVHGGIEYGQLTA
jgi:hypothetical protein